MTTPEEVFAGLLTGGGISERHRTNARTLLDSFSKCSRSALAGYVESDGERGQWIIEEVLIKNASGREAPARVRRDVMDVVLLAPVINKFMPYDDLQPSEMLDMVEEISSYYEKLYRNKQRAQLIQAYTVSFCTAFDEDRTLEELAYIAEHLDQLSLHAKTIFDRGTMERDFIEQLANNNVPALSEGIL